jgi:hypothetical protein
MNDQQLEVISWWYGRRDYYTGIALLSRYCRNKTIVHSLNKPGKENFISSVHKLNYEVTKAVHLDWLHMPKDPSSDFQTGENNPVENSSRNLRPAEKNNPADTSIPEEEEEAPDDLSQYPKVIRRLKYEYSNLYKKRSMLHADMRVVDENNTAKSVALRKSLLVEIKSISKQLEYYYSFIDAFEKKGVVPNEETIWPVEKPTEPEEPKTLAQLKQLKWTMQSETAKDRSRLLYQQRTKGEKENPMPQGPKRDAIELRLKLREQKMAEITQQITALENAG